jgi:single-strand DNA-binding protein
MSLNTVTLTGRAGRDPEVKFFESGTAVAQFSLAVDGFAKDGKKPTHWVDIKVWGKSAQFCADYLRKGGKVGVVGRLEQEKWTSKDGDERSKLVVVADRVELLGDKQQEDEEVPF